MLKHLRLKKDEDRRVRGGHPWVYSNEVATNITPLSAFEPGEEVLVEAHDKTPLGIAYINPHSLITARLFSHYPDARLNGDFFRQKIAAAYELRKNLFAAPYYRLVFSEADQLPGLVIDRFDEDFVVQTNTAGMENKKEVIAESLRKLFPETKSILLRNDSQIREHEGLETYVKPLYGTPPEEVKLEENGVHFYAPLLKGQKTAWFYDHRLNRARLKEYVRDKNVLDVFSYLGGFAVSAAVSGASSVDCVESSKLACEYIQKNAELNKVSHKMTVIHDEAFDALKTLVQHNKRYDVIILDPPAFVKRLKDRKEGLLAYRRINALAIKLLNPNGILVSCSCSMHISMDELVNALKKASDDAHAQLQILERGHQAPDHPVHLAIPETDYLKAVFMRKLS